MRYGKMVPGTFLSRPNRFIARVETAEGEQVVHVKNKGRCRELLTPGCRVWLEESANPARKTRYDLITVDKQGLLVNMDSQAPNRVFREWAEQGRFLPGVTAVRGEYTWGDSRLDFCLETERGLHLVEVKGVTLETDGHARFPDAPTERGVKHIRELQRAVAAGLDATLFFVIQMEGMQSLSPNDKTHPAFGEALRQAAAAGVRVEARGCRVTPDTLEIGEAVPVIL